MQKITCYIWAFLTLAIWPCLYLFPDVNPYDEKRILQVGLLLLVGFLFILNTRLIAAPLNSQETHSFLFHRINKIGRWGITLFLPLGIISTWVNYEWYFGILELSLYVLLFVFFLYVAAGYAQNSQRFNKALYLLAAGFAGLYFLKFMIGYGMYLAGHYPLWPGSYTVSILFGWSNIRFFNHVQTWTLPLLVSLSVTLKSRSKLGSYAVVGLSAFWWCLIFASGAQGSLIALVCSTVLIGFVYRQKAGKWIKFLFISLLIGLALYFLLFYLQGDRGASVIDNSTKGRLALWSLISKQILIHPLLGFGPLSLASVHNLPSMTHPHNSVLRLMYEFGIPATLIALGLVGWGMIRWLAWNRQKWGTIGDQERFLRIGLSVSLCAGMAHSLVSGVMIMSLSQLWFCIIAGWAMGIYMKNNPDLKSDSLRIESKRSLKSAPILALKGFVIAAIVVMSYTMITDIPNLDTYHKKYVKKYSVGYVPRFWAQGKRILND